MFQLITAVLTPTCLLSNCSGFFTSGPCSAPLDFTHSVAKSIDHVGWAAVYYWGSLWLLCKCCPGWRGGVASVQVQDCKLANKSPFMAELIDEPPPCRCFCICPTVVTFNHFCETHLIFLMCYCVNTGRNFRFQKNVRLGARHQCLNSSISPISLLFLFIKFGVGLVSLKLVSKHVQPGNSLWSVSVKRRLPQPVWKVLWVMTAPF